MIAANMWQSLAAVASWPSSNPTRSAISHVSPLPSMKRSPAPHSPSDVMAADGLTPGRSSSSRPNPARSPPYQDVEYDLSTIPDPRSRVLGPAVITTSPAPHHPDLTDEVAALSTKLINAINHQTTLDDSLSSTRLELDQSRQTIHRLEEQIARQKEMLSGDVWVRRKAVESDKNKLLARIAEEKKLRDEADEQKKKIEVELENLTAALFEEANKMVISAKEDARKEQEALQRKTDQLKAQLADTEGLLKSQQEQLTELKHVMEQMTADRDDQTAQTSPSSPGLSKFDLRDEDSPLSGHPQSGLVAAYSPSYPTSFTHLIQPVLRTDLASYSDFRDLIRLSKRWSAHRVSSGSHSGLAALGLGLSVSGSIAMISPNHTPIVASQSIPQTPNTPNSTASAGSAVSAANLPSLKDTKFYKRVVAEDVEPTLRLDIAPGLSWLARRTVLSAVTEGSLVVEPIPTNSASAGLTKPQLYPCSLCGDSRKDDEHLRMHRFRTSDSESAQRYPLCRYCLGRVRSTCDFLGFLRLIKDGHWRADDEDAEKAAWEESVRLREQMFWSRIGGGVVPASHVHQSHSTAATSVSDERSPRVSQEVASCPEIVPKYVGVCELNPVVAPKEAPEARETEAAEKTGAVEETVKVEETAEAAVAEAKPAETPALQSEDARNEGSAESPDTPVELPSQEGSSQLAPETAGQSHADDIVDPPTQEETGKTTEAPASTSPSGHVPTSPHPPTRPSSPVPQGATPSDSYTVPGSWDA